MLVSTLTVGDSLWLINGFVMIQPLAQMMDKIVLLVCIINEMILWCLKFAVYNDWWLIDIVEIIVVFDDYFHGGDEHEQLMFDGWSNSNQCQT